MSDGTGSARAFELPPLEPLGPAVVAAATTRADDREAEMAAAREAGFAAGMQEARDELQTAVAALRAAAASLEAARDEAAEATEQAAVELGLKIAEQAMAGALAVDPDRVVDVVRGALRRLVERERVIVLVHPDDLEAVRLAHDGLLAELGGIESCEIQAERRMTRGGAVVRTSEGEVDATLEAKLIRARAVVEEALSDTPEEE